jgi:gamma-glutamylcyclotransferase (GGCT)/AIG2-like uncharacterized protein YtfP
VDKHLVFVYGSLRRGNEQSMSVRFPSSRFIGEATVSGSLYDLGAYSGLVSNDSNRTVVGEVYEVDEELLNQLDEFEATSNYLRKQVEISIGTERMTGWVYEPDLEYHSPHTLITSGDWAEYARTKSPES